MRLETTTTELQNIATTPSGLFRREKYEVRTVIYVTIANRIVPAVVLSTEVK